MLLTIPFAAFLLALIAGHGLMRRGQRGALGAVAGALAALGLGALWREGSAPGIDGLFYTLLIWGAVLPGLAALAMGAFIGWLDRRGALAA